MLIGKDGGLSTLCHSCGFDYQKRVLKTFVGLGYLYSENRVVCIYIGHHFILLRLIPFDFRADKDGLWFEHPVSQTTIHFDYQQRVHLIFTFKIQLIHSIYLCVHWVEDVQKMSNFSFSNFPTGTTDFLFLTLL